MEKDKEYSIISQKKYVSSYYQIAIFDAEEPDAYPEWKIGKEIIVFGKYGAVVVVANDSEIETTVILGKFVPSHKLCVSSEIIINNQGLIVGNIPSASTDRVLVPRGCYSITIMTDEIGTNTHKVWFILSSLDKNCDE